MTASHVPVVDGDAALPVAFPESRRLRMGGDRRDGPLGVILPIIPGVPLLLASGAGAVDRRSAGKGRVETALPLLG